MRKLSGLVLDRYDDVDGTVLRTIPRDGLPMTWVEALVKRAHPFTSDELARLPDDAFSVVLQDGGQTLRKYARADLGNTCLHAEYFLKTGHRLPVEAQKVAAANLIEGLSWYRQQPTCLADLEKVALGVGSLIGGALVVPGAAREASSNLKAVRGAGPGILTPAQIQSRRLQMGV
jgi:hypothetical protein